jgi:hypothetical protein
MVLRAEVGVDFQGAGARHDHHSRHPRFANLDVR